MIQKCNKSYVHPLLGQKHNHKMNSLFARNLHWTRGVNTKPWQKEVDHHLDLDVFLGLILTVIYYKEKVSGRQW